jgi:hypothetical protein
MEHRVRGLVGPKRASPEECEDAIVEALPSGGLRVRSGARLAMNDSIILYLETESHPVRAKVLAARPAGVMDKRRTGKPGQAYVADCRIRREPRGGIRLALILRWAILAGALGLAAFLLHGLVTILQLLR